MNVLSLKVITVNESFPRFEKKDINSSSAVTTSAKAILLAVLLVACLVINLPRGWLSSLLQDKPCQLQSNDRYEDGKLGAVASESSICSRHGIEMLKMGGNAADAVSDMTLMRCSQKTTQIR